jgi:superfamily I DNA/RNA helicase
VKSRSSGAGARLLEGLNPAQREAVTTTEGPLLVLAGAGTGKTRVITTRVAYLLAEGARPEEVLGVTFTNKAAREMRERLESLLGGRSGRQGRGPLLSTFHSLGMRLLRAEAEAIGYRRSFTIHDTTDQTALVRTLLREVHGTSRPGDPGAVLAAISRAKNRFLLPEALLDAAGDEYEVLVARIYSRYREHLRDLNAVDFDDLILLPVIILEGDPAAAERYRRRWRHILVDEYQDTNASQYRFLRQLVGPERNLCVVGDDDQSIYGFRGAEMDKILRFEEDFPGARVVRLEENYRSTPAVLALANAVIEGNACRRAKTLRPSIAGGPPVRLVVTEDEAAEVNFVVREIQSLLSGGAGPGRRAGPGEVAVLLRAAIQARPFEEKLRLHRIPYTLVGGQSYFDRKEIRDVLAYWKVLANPRDDLSLLRVINVPRRGLGSKTVRALDDLAHSLGVAISEALERAGAGEGDFARDTRAAITAFAEILVTARERLASGEITAAARGIITDAQYEQAIAELYSDPLVRQGRWNAVEDLLASVERWRDEQPDATFSEFLGALSLEEDERRDAREERRSVLLMTLHSAKGLEFPRVYLAGLEEDLIPHRKSLEDGDGAIEEERRLLYVGITRARHELTLMASSSRRVYGAPRERLLSRFLTEVGDRGLWEVVEDRARSPASAEDVEGFLETYRRRTRRG